MANSFLWKSAVSADWSVATDWGGGAVPGDPVNDHVLITTPGNYFVTIASGESFGIFNLNETAGSLFLQGGGALSIAGPSFLGATAVIVGGGVLNGVGSLVSGGVIAGNDPVNFLQIGMGGFTNTGTVLAFGSGHVFIFSQNFSNLSGNTLSGGVYEVDGPAFGTLSSILVNIGPGTASEVVTDNATITLNGEATAFAGNNGVGYTNLEFTLNSITSAGVLNVIGGRDYLGNQTLSNAGILTIGGGDFNPAGLVSSGLFRGYGTVEVDVANTGIIESNGGILTLKGAVTDTGLLVVDANSVMALSGVFNSPIVDNGILQAKGGLLKILGGAALSGSGSIVIDSQPSNVAGTLELVGEGHGTIAFNGPRGMLKLDAPALFTGSVTGFGQGDFSGRAADTIDLVGMVANGATLVGNTLQVKNNGIVVDTLTLNGDYSGTGVSFKAVGDGAGGTDITVLGANASDYSLEGPYWHSKTITWSFATSNLPDEQRPGFSDFFTTGTLPGDTRDQTQYQAVVRSAFGEWASIAGFNFVEVADFGGFRPAHRLGQLHRQHRDRAGEFQLPDRHDAGGFLHPPAGPDGAEAGRGARGDRWAGL